MLKIESIIKLRLNRNMNGWEKRIVISVFGYHWIGYYTPEDIEKINLKRWTSTTWYCCAGSDLKYADLNGDGMINDFDKRAISKPNLPTTTLGWTIGGSWKGLVSVLFQGSFDYSFAINGTDWVW